jgi:hypothetical protein
MLRNIVAFAQSGARVPTYDECWLLENICIKVSGASALVHLNDRDYFGEVGLGDIEGAFTDVEAFAAAYGTEPWHVMGACDFVIGQLISQHLGDLDNLTQKLLKISGHR